MELGEGVELAGTDDGGGDLQAEALLQDPLDLGADGGELGRVALGDDRDDQFVAVLTRTARTK